MQYLHSMVRVVDLNQALDFYCHKLGLVEIKRSEHKEGRFTLVFLAAPGDVSNAKQTQAPLLELTYNWPDDKQTTSTYSTGRNFGHLAYGVDNIYEYCQHLMDHNVEILRPPRDGRMAFIQSPDGISIELLQAGEALAPQEPWVSMKNIGSW